MPIICTKLFIEARARWRAVDRAAILHNVLMQPAGFKVRLAHQ
jgi:hypothetical protein